MADYRELVEKYKKRRRDTLVDAVTTGLTYADNVAVDIGLLNDTDIAADTLDAVSVALPFAVIAVTEQMKVIMGKKEQKHALSDATFRMLKTGAALGIGTAVGTVGGLAAAIPAAVGVRTLMDKYKSRSLTALRVASRTERLKSLRDFNAQRFTKNAPASQDILPDDIEKV